MQPGDLSDPDLEDDVRIRADDTGDVGSAAPETGKDTRFDRGARQGGKGALRGVRLETGQGIESRRVVVLR